MNWTSNPRPKNYRIRSMMVGFLFVRPLIYRSPSRLPVDYLTRTSCRKATNLRRVGFSPSYLRGYMAGTRNALTGPELLLQEQQQERGRGGSVSRSSTAAEGRGSRVFEDRLGIWLIGGEFWLGFGFQSRLLEMVMKKPDYLFLGQPTWETLPSGRVRCIQTGHEMPPEAQATYSQTKKCRAALFDAALKKRTAPLNFFEQSPDNKDKIVCQLTGVVLNKKEDAVWKHMMGKKFEAKLAERETEKERVQCDVDMTENNSEEQVTKKGSKKKEKFFDDAEMMENGTEKQNPKKTGKKNGNKFAKSRNEEEVKDDEEAVCSEDSEFWIPPPGDRWDFDDGGEDRWSRRGDPDAVDQTVEGEPDDDTEMAEGEDGSNNSSSDQDVKIRTKRTAGGSSKQMKRRKAKRLRKGGDE